MHIWYLCACIVLYANEIERKIKLYILYCTNCDVGGRKKKKTTSKRGVMCTHAHTNTYEYTVETDVHARYTQRTKQRKNTPFQVAYTHEKIHIHTHTQSRLSVLGWTKIKLLAKRNRVYKYPAGSNDDSFYPWFIDPFLFPPFFFFFFDAIFSLTPLLIP